MPKKPPPSALADKFMLRLPDGMRDRIAAEAKASGRSMNAEIIYQLEKSYADADQIVRNMAEDPNYEKLVRLILDQIKKSGLS